MSSRFSAVLLAGGKSSRMGRDKAFLEIGGIPLWQRQLRILHELAPAEIFLAGPPHRHWQAVRCKVIADTQENSGPLGGVAAALSRSTTGLVLALAVDLPFITTDHLLMLLGRCSDTRGVVPVGDRHEPLAAIYPTRALTIAQQLLQSGDFAMRTFTRRCLRENLVIEDPIDPADARLFLNMNTPAALSSVAAVYDRRTGWAA